MAVKSLAQSSLVEPFSTNSMLAGYSGNAFHHLETVRLSSNAASVTFSNLARYSDFQHLQIRAVARSSRTEINSGIYMQLNGVTTQSYTAHGLYGLGSGSAASYSIVSRVSMLSIPISAANATSNAFGAAVIDILDPFDSNKNTTGRALSGVASNFNVVELSSGLFLSTAAVNSITLITINNYIAGSRFSLYGIKARA